jgi:hypothetical protein
MTTSSSPEKEKELKRTLQIVRDVYAGHFDDYFAKHPPEEGLREIFGEEGYKEIVSILENRVEKEEKKRNDYADHE